MNTNNINRNKNEYSIELIKSKDSTQIEIKNQKYITKYLNYRLMLLIKGYYDKNKDKIFLKDLIKLISKYYSTDFSYGIKLIAEKYPYVFHEDHFSKKNYQKSFLTKN